MNIHAERGALFETLVIAEFVKARFNDGKPADLYFWRDNSGTEIDLVLDSGTGLAPGRRASAIAPTPERGSQPGTRSGAPANS